MSEQINLAERVLAEALRLGADEAGVSVSSGSHTTIVRRDGKVEQATEATNRDVSVSLFVDGRSSSHSTSDLRDEAITWFLKRAIAATRYLEPDLDRRQPEGALCGRGASEAALDQYDATFEARLPESRAELASEMEQSLRKRFDDRVISGSTWCADGKSQVARVLSNGFSGEHQSTGFSLGGDVTLDEGNGKRPEAAAYFSARHLEDLPSIDFIADEVMDRAKERLGAGPIESGTYPLILLNRAAGRIFGMLGGPISGGSIFEKRSCLADKLGEAIASPSLTIMDDPTIPRGMGSRPWDGDALRAAPRTIIKEGVLENFYINVYYGRRLSMEPTSGSRSNWIVAPGARSWQEVAAQYDKAILVNSFLGGNNNGISGDFSFGIRGVLLENGQPTRSLSEMNVSGNILTLFKKIVAVGNDPWMYSANQIPTVVFEDVDFSGL